MTFSDKLYDAMRSKKISIRELADMTGIPKSAVQRYVSGETDKIPIDRMKLMAEALSVDPAYVMGWSDISSSLGSDSPAAQKLRAIGEALSGPMPPDESELLSIYRDLNDVGRQALLGTARGLAANPDMKKDGELNTGTA